MIRSVPIPLQDELAIGLLGRFTRLNGLPSTARMAQSLRAGQSKKDETPLLWLTAVACGQDESVFSARHSMLPVMYPISRYVGNERHAGSKHERTYRRGMTLPTEKLRWCPECSRMDIEKRGFSYWRRQHQVAGVDWCIDHRLSLICAPSEVAINAPGHQATYGPLSTAQANIEEEAHYPALLRLQQIMVGWLHRPNPIRLAAWAEVVGEQCRSAGLRIGEIGKRPVVSDRIQKMFPASWLTRYMPEIASKAPQAFVRKVDGACIDKHVIYPALACAAILAVLFESAEQALAALEMADHRLAALRPEVSASDEALTAFLAGLGLHEACQMFGVSVSRVEAILRQGLQWQRQSG